MIYHEIGYTWNPFEQKSNQDYRITFDIQARTTLFEKSMKVQMILAGQSILGFSIFYKVKLEQETCYTVPKGELEQ